MFAGVVKQGFETRSNIERMDSILFNRGKSIKTCMVEKYFFILATDKAYYKEVGTETKTQR